MKIYLFLIFVLMFAFSACDDNSTDSNNSGNNPPANEVWMRGNTFVPASITVNPGTTIRWVNKDAVSHTATSSSSPQLFDSGTLGRDGSFSFTFSAAGTYPYFCKLHSGMTGSVVVQ